MTASWREHPDFYRDTYEPRDGFCVDRDPRGRWCEKPVARCEEGEFEQLCPKHLRELGVQERNAS